MSLSLFSHIHLQAHLVQVASVCLTYQKAISADTMEHRVSIYLTIQTSCYKWF